MVVNWEQPRAGKSFAAVDRLQLSPERHVNDGIVLVNYFRERFDDLSSLSEWIVSNSPSDRGVFI